MLINKAMDKIALLYNISKGMSYLKDKRIKPHSIIFVQ